MLITAEPSYDTIYIITCLYRYCHIWDQRDHRTSCIDRLSLFLSMAIYETNGAWRGNTLHPPTYWTHPPTEPHPPTYKRTGSCKLLRPPHPPGSCITCTKKISVSYMTPKNKRRRRTCRSTLTEERKKESGFVQIVDRRNAGPAWWSTQTNAWRAYNHLAVFPFSCCSLWIR